MLKDHLEQYYFDGNYNCAESVLRAGNEYYGLDLHDRDMILIGGFGAGVQTGHACGAILACVSILSMQYIEAKAHESEDIQPAVALLLEKFSRKYGSLLCETIKPQSFQPEVRCLKAVRDACDILEETLLEYENSLLDTRLTE